MKSPAKERKRRARIPRAAQRIFERKKEFCQGKAGVSNRCRADAREAGGAKSQSAPRRRVFLAGKNHRTAATLVSGSTRIVGVITLPSAETPRPKRVVRAKRKPASMAAVATEESTFPAG